MNVLLPRECQSDYTQAVREVEIGKVE